MAYQFETVKLDKGMYSEAGRSFTKVLEKCDPSEQYKGTPLEHLDAFQRQLKRFDIKVKGADSDVVSKFFASWESAVLFPEYVARAVRQGMEENNILPLMTAAETRISGMDYRSIASTPTEEEKSLKMVAEGAMIPETRVSAQENLVKLHKRGRMLVASYEAIQFQRLDLFSVTLRQIGAYINRMHVADAIDVICNGDGNKNGADQYTVGTKPIAGTAGTLSYDALVDFWSQFDPYTMNTLLVGDAMAQILKLEEMQDSTAGLAFQGTGDGSGTRRRTAWGCCGGVESGGTPADRGRGCAGDHRAGGAGDGQPDGTSTAPAGGVVAVRAAGTGQTARPGGNGRTGSDAFCVDGIPGAENDSRLGRIGPGGAAGCPAV